MKMLSIALVGVSLCLVSGAPGRTWTEAESGRTLEGDLVRVETMGGAEVFVGLGEKGAVGKRGDAGILHASGDEVGDDDIEILVPRIGDADFALEEGEDPGGVAK